MQKPEYMTEGEYTVTQRLVAELLSHGFSVSVWDGGNDDGERVVTRSRDATEIIGAMASTGGDTLGVYDTSERPMGFVILIWGNDDDGSELIHNYTDTLRPYFAETWEYVMAM